MNLLQKVFKNNSDVSETTYSINDWSQPGSWSEFARMHPGLCEKDEYIEAITAQDYGRVAIYGSPVFNQGHVELTTETIDRLEKLKKNEKAVTWEHMVRLVITDAALEYESGQNREALQQLVEWFMYISDAKPTFNYVTPRVTKLLTDDFITSQYLLRMTGGMRWDQDWVPITPNEIDWYNSQMERLSTSYSQDNLGSVLPNHEPALGHIAIESAIA